MRARSLRRRGFRRHHRRRRVEAAAEQDIVHARGLGAGRGSRVGRDRGRHCGHRAIDRLPLHLRADADLAMHAFGPQRQRRIRIVAEDLGRSLAVPEIVERAREQPKVTATVGHRAGDRDTDAAAGAADAGAAEAAFDAGRGQARSDHRGGARVGPGAQGVAAAVAVAVAVGGANVAVAVIAATADLGLRTGYDEQQRRSDHENPHPTLLFDCPTCSSHVFLPHVQASTCPVWRHGRGEFRLGELDGPLSPHGGTKESASVARLRHVGAQRPRPRAQNGGKAIAGGRFRKISGAFAHGMSPGLTREPMPIRVRRGGAAPGRSRCSGVSRPASRAVRAADENGLQQGWLARQSRRSDPSHWYKAQPLF